MAEEVCCKLYILLLPQLANYLKDVGVRKGDTVVIYLPMLMELPIAMLACARIGAVHSVLHIVPISTSYFTFSDFSVLICSFPKSHIGVNFIIWQHL